MIEHVVRLVAEIAGLLALLITVVVSPFLISLIKRVEFLEKQQDKYQRRDYRMRLLLSTLINFIKTFKGNVLDVLNYSYKNQTPVTKAQLERLSNTKEIDDLIEPLGDNGA